MDRYFQERPIFFEALILFFGERLTICLVNVCNFVLTQI